MNLQFHGLNVLALHHDPILEKNGFQLQNARLVLLPLTGEPHVVGLVTLPNLRYAPLKRKVAA